MSTAQAQAPATIDRDNYLIEYTPFAEKEPIKLSRAIVRRVVAIPTRSGALPTDADIDKFILLNRAKELNPFTGDSFLVGYDSKDGPKFSLITAIQALLKRAEANPAFDGMESGIVVRRGDQIVERPGNLVYPGEVLFGGWARLWRRDRSHPFYDSLLLSAYKPPYHNPQWEKDGPGMIDKCAQASVLRQAFPSQLSALYIAQEMGLVERAEAVEHVPPSGERVTTIEGLTKQIAAKSAEHAKPAENGHKQAHEAHEGDTRHDGQAEGHEAAAAEDSPQEPAGEVDGLKVIREEFTKAKTEKAIDKVYDAAMGPDSSAQWTPLQEKAIEGLRAEAKSRVAAAKASGKKGGELFENKPGAVEGGQ